jgi:hypothetical protein
MKLQNKIDRLENIIETYDTSLSSISGMITACLNEHELSDWQAKSVLRCILATASFYASETRNDLESLDD